MKAEPVKMQTARFPRTMFWWLTGNAIGLIAWLVIAWAIWPWPNYGHCDFPVAPWRYLFASTPGRLFLAHVIFLIIAVAEREQNV